MASRIFVCKSHSSAAYRETVVDQLFSQGSVGKGEKHPFPRVPLKEIFLHSWKAALWGPSFQQSAEGAEVLPFGTLIGPGTPSTSVWNINNKIGGLDNHKGLRDNQKVGQAKDRLISYVTSPLKTRRSGCFTYCMETKTERQGKWRNWGIHYKQKKKIKGSETDFNGKEISDLPDRVQNDGHKDVHWNEVKNVWTSEDFNKEVENIRKYQTESQRWRIQ